MSLTDTIRLALGPVHGIAERLSALERDVIENALGEVYAVCQDEEREQRISADMILELHQQVDDLEADVRANEKGAP